MTDIIPFPQNQSKLINDIKTSFNHEQYDEMYDLFMKYEKDFELDTDLALLKCEMLLRMEQYLELREEAIILLKQGFDAYNRLMVYYMTSLHGLGQYYECVNLFNQIIDQVKDHDIRMQLFPIKEDAQMQLNQNKKHYISKMSRFTTLTIDQQLYLLFDMMHEGQYGFAETFAEILNQERLHSHVQTIILEYLKKAQYQHEINFVKNNAEFKVVPKALPGLEYASFTQKVIPAVMQQFEDQFGSQMRSEISQMLQGFAIGIYPLEIEQEAPVDAWIDTFFNYIEDMLNLSESAEKHMSEPVLKWIHAIEQNITQ
ncbi:MULTISPECIES: hypothetical protein [Staphylococcus]|uniref:hypothetical protein n=1 Tax=Staphylococcus TaxID=1279 RepID=UPI000763E5C5|nr:MULTISPECIES: hypothetical protein [Staphylococcus]KXA41114.1 hypothetical protein HMPREF3215_02533 [Staphylococcus simulans]OFM19779.1 hypothetical protein HMPREF2713_03865 [Staphylococcus sp. HMSC059E03]OFN22533.1 hypothetical protein HMPREF2603_10990 [Staphylococcus sp. HMSC055C03]OFU80782.1 hypothetical protein HMPREF3110_01760 [Staphylococcus sp. HMSC10C03]OFV04966.1 hypothetical protein HMPREF3124_08940 [Staphylococcus sp. HMSC12H08]